MPAKLISIGELIDHSWEHYREQFQSYVSISGWSLLVAIINVIAIAFYPSATKLLVSNADMTALEIFGVFLFAFSSLVVAPLLNLFVLIGIVRMARSVLANRGASMKRTVSEIKSRFLPALLISLMYLLIIFLAALLPLLPAGVFGLLSVIFHNETLLTIANILLALGVFVSAFLGARWGVDYYLAPYFVIHDDEKLRPALMHSRTVIQGRFWHVFLRIIAPKVVFLLFGVLMIWVLNLFFVVLFSGISGLNLDLQVRLSSFTDTVIPLIITVLVQPLVILSDVLLLNSLKAE